MRELFFPCFFALERWNGIVIYSKFCSRHLCIVGLNNITLWSLFGHPLIIHSSLKTKSNFSWLKGLLPKVTFAFGMGPKQEFFIRLANDYFFYFCISMTQNNFFSSANSNIFPWYLLLFPCDHSFPTVIPNTIDPHALLQHARRSTMKVKQGLKRGVWGNYSENIKCTSARRSIINF